MTTTSAPRLGHCTPTWGGHSPACDRDGTYCALASSHDGPCKPHGSKCPDCLHADHSHPNGTRYECPWCECGEQS